MWGEWRWGVYGITFDSFLLLIIILFFVGVSINIVENIYLS